VVDPEYTVTTALPVEILLGIDPDCVHNLSARNNNGLAILSSKPCLLVPVSVLVFP
jgi:hypothetical protein